ncbi:MAG: xylose isomerase [Anaeroplasmataceae bacterium]|nr:xylose isomerase [Anaeroplasmataceae bacterium]
MKEYFKIGKINYEGANSKNPLAFKYYNAEEMILGKPMKQHLKFAMSWWHTLCAKGSDQFGGNTMERTFDAKDPMEEAYQKVDAGFEFMEKLGIEYFCFHDRDMAPEMPTLKESNDALDKISDYVLEKMKQTNIQCLWGTANCFNHKRYLAGAGTSPNADAFAYAAAQIKKAMDTTKKLGGKNYVFWGGREGYDTLLNTDIKMELDHYATLLTIARDYNIKSGLNAQLLIEPKPKEPTKHQYDFDVQTVLGFLKTYGLEKDFKMNIEANHATLAIHTFQHELNVARVHGVLGSIDANQGDMLLGWDTDQFPTNIYDATLAMYEVLKNGGLGTGGLNFDAKVRRQSFTDEDLFLSYIAGMDTFAKGLRIAAKLLEDQVFEKYIKERYVSYEDGIGKKIHQKKVTLEELSAYALEHDQVKNVSGRQELLEMLLNQYILD